ncbi:MAG: carboxypeptidase M32 [Lachnospiraceae bacterium]|nr:carboxypeptidase M32 [Lachnospiraceae bacterium]
MNELEYIKSKLEIKELLDSASRIITFDQMTIAPAKGISDKNEIIAHLTEEVFKTTKDPEFDRCVLTLYEKRDDIEDELDRVLIKQLYRNYLIEKNLTPEDTYNISLNEQNAFVAWSEAKEASDYSIFKEPLNKVIEGCKLKAERRELSESENNIIKDDYDKLLDIFEQGMTQKDIDPLFSECREGLITLTEKIKNSKKKIRSDFLSRPVGIEAQRRVTEYLMGLMGFDKERGIFSTSEHGYTELLTPNDIRITTHFYEDNFISSIYTVTHETGHALFDQNQPSANFKYFITGGKTLGMHESVSRFYENVLGRSKGFIHMIYPTLKELMPEALYDVSERELYEAVNIVTPSLIRTEADEVTYGFHVIIRYELEKAIFSGNLSVDDLPAAWNDKYEEYLGIRPDNDRDGVLQDIHWASDFGYFPTYLLGNFYNTMYYNRMKNEIDVEAVLNAGDITPINKWMIDNVFAKADRLSPKEWIKDITGRSVTSADFIKYLNDKYYEIYEL